VKLVHLVGFIIKSYAESQRNDFKVLSLHVFQYNVPNRLLCVSTKKRCVQHTLCLPLYAGMWVSEVKSVVWVIVF
jgi:hypothetical protein